MSRIGKKPVTFPKNVKVSQNFGTVKVEGPKGALSSKLPEGINMVVSDGNLVVERKSDERIDPVLSWFGQNFDRKYGNRCKYWFCKKPGNIRRRLSCRTCRKHLEAGFRFLQSGSICIFPKE